MHVDASFAIATSTGMEEASSSHQARLVLLCFTIADGLPIQTNQSPPIVFPIGSSVQAQEERAAEKRGIGRRGTQYFG